MHHEYTAHSCTESRCLPETKSFLSIFIFSSSSFSSRCHRWLCFRHFRVPAIISSSSGVYFITRSFSVHFNTQSVFFSLICTARVHVYRIYHFSLFTAHKAAFIQVDVPAVLSALQLLFLTPPPKTSTPPLFIYQPSILSVR